MKKIILLAIIFFPVYLFSQNNNSNSKKAGQKKPKENSFEYLLQKCKLEFTIPEEFKIIKPKKNSDISYQFAIKDKNENYEIRYFIIPFDQFYKDSANKIDPNRNSNIFLTTTVLNASGYDAEHIPEINTFPAEYVQNEFNADWGAVSLFAPKSDFGKGYKYCVVNSIRKDSVCQVFFIDLFDDFRSQFAIYNEHFYTIKFKPGVKWRTEYHKIEREEEFPGANDFYINTYEGLLKIRIDNKEVKSADITVSDNYGKIYYQKTMNEKLLEITTLAKGKYRLKIRYGDKEINRLIEIF
jgi:hypothetical protein